MALWMAGLAMNVMPGGLADIRDAQDGTLDIVDTIMLVTDMRVFHPVSSQTNSLE